MDAFNLSASLAGFQQSFAFIHAVEPFTLLSDFLLLYIIIKVRALLLTLTRLYMSVTLIFDIYVYVCMYMYLKNNSKLLTINIKRAVDSEVVYHVKDEKGHAAQKADIHNTTLYKWRICVYNAVIYHV